MPPWGISDIPDQRGRRAIVTGGSTGIGFEIARALAAAGMAVTIAARDEARGAAAARMIRGLAPGAEVRFARLDLASLASVRGFAEAELLTARPLDLLVNNAGVMMLPRRETTADGFERQFATNHLGPFALTARLWPLFTGRAGARVATVASLAHWRGRIDLADLDAAVRYRPYAAYARSKLANLLFAFELARLAGASGPLSVAAHPGIAATPLVRNGRAGDTGLASRLLIAWYDVVGQDAASGALPILRAATAPDVRAGAYFGPRGPFGFRGPAGLVRASGAARDAAVAARLWTVSEERTGLRFAPGPAAGAGADGGDSAAPAGGALP
ncbi:MAG: SDR family NAD(P)-dependent oxidoreductase [Bauldia sp.]|nr:SDR family NAD(P)-dependent oxidoreductase [Bauldia sp.]